MSRDENEPMYVVSRRAVRRVALISGAVFVLAGVGTGAFIAGRSSAPTPVTNAGMRRHNTHHHPASSSSAAAHTPVVPTAPTITAQPANPTSTASSAARTSSPEPTAPTPTVASDYTAFIGLWQNPAGTVNIGSGGTGTVTWSPCTSVPCEASPSANASLVLTSANGDSAAGATSGSTDAAVLSDGSVAVTVDGTTGVMTVSGLNYPGTSTAAPFCLVGGPSANNGTCGGAAGL